MKITCQSCAAKYTIADEKVAGKTVKIKCKKCGATIVVNGNEAGFQAASDAAAYGAGAQAAPPEEEGGGDGQTTVFSGEQGAAAPAGGGDWTVNVADDDQRTMSSAQIAEAFAAGIVTNDTYVWKDGMADWSPLSGVPELVSLVSKPAPRPAAGMAAPAPAPAAAAAAEPAPAPAAARRAVTREAADPFAAREQQVAAATPPPKLDKAVGERNENSMLFSISALTAAKETRDKERSATSKASGKASMDDIMNLGGGIAAPPILAAPPVLAPVVEAPPPPPQPMAQPGGMAMGGMHGAQAMPGAGMMMDDNPYAQKKKSNTGLIIGIVAGLAVVGGVVAFFATRSPETDPNATAQSTAVTATVAPTTPTAAPTPTQVAAADTAATSPSGTPADTSGSKTSSGGTTGSGGPTGPAGTNTGKAADPKATATATATAAPTTAPTTTAAPTATAADGAEFNRAAAMSALSAAAGAAKGCKKPDGPTGSGKVKVTFAPSGNVTSAQVEGPPFAGTPVGGCIASAFRGAKVPPFAGAPVSVSKSFSIN